MSTTVNGVDEILALAGTDLGHTEWKAVEQDRINTFADATDDHQWIHTDPEAAKDGPFGGAIAHGYLTLSLLIPLWTEMVEMEGVTTKVNYGLNKVRFPAPVPAGSTIRLGAVVAETKEVGGGGVEVVADFTVECDASDKPVCIAQAVYRYYP
jgi:acyl dehydratase